MRIQTANSYPDGMAVPRRKFRGMRQFEYTRCLKYLRNCSINLCRRPKISNLRHAHLQKRAPASPRRYPYRPLVVKNNLCRLAVA